MSTADSMPADIDALRAALAAAEAARREAEARASGAEAMVAHLKLLIARLKHDRFGASSERSRKLIDQMELELEELEAAASEDATIVAAAGGTEVTSFTRRKPVRGPLPEHLPRERVVLAAPSDCPCCGGRLAKLGEDVTETLEVVPRQWKVIQCQSARKKDPRSASKKAPLYDVDMPRCCVPRSRRRRGAQQRGRADRRVAVGWRQARFLNRQLSLPVSTMSQ
jgi:hypothetical protein